MNKTHFVWYQQLGVLLFFFFTHSDIWGHSWDGPKSSVSLLFSLNLAKLPGLSCNPWVNRSSRCTFGDSPSPHVVLNAPVSRLEHLVVLLLTEEDVRLEQVLVERVHASTQTALLANPLACLDVHYVPCRISQRETLLTSRLTSDSLPELRCNAGMRVCTYPTGPFRCSSGSTGLEQLVWPPTRRWSRRSGGSKSQTPPAGSLHLPCKFRWCNQQEPPFSGSPGVQIKDKRQKMRDETCLR